jgi:hypothetical protein
MGIGVLPPTGSSEPDPLVEATGSPPPSWHASEHSPLWRSPRPMTVSQAASESGAKNARRRTAEVNLKRRKLKTFP